MAAHQAAKKFLHFDSELDIGNTERYLWALSIGTHPHVSEKLCINEIIFIGMC